MKLSISSNANPPNLLNPFRDIKIIEPSAESDERRATAKVKGGYDIEEVARAALCLMPSAQVARVDFFLRGVDAPVTVKVLDTLKTVKAAAVQNIVAATPLKLKDPDAWRTIVDVCGDSFFEKRMIDFTARWAKLMQYEIEVNGKPLEQIADKAFDLANDNPRGRFMYGDAPAFTLLQTWVYDDELGAWMLGGPLAPSRNPRTQQVMNMQDPHRYIL
ncbi:MAG: hypothetical protein FWF24_01375 [Alphaproteobacteria bacterium]|nr:hypothetical protein [Alphaproteobacteria bacterium]